MTERKIKPAFLLWERSNGVWCGLKKNKCVAFEVDFS